MSVKFAINGFGRIGRLVARIAATRPGLELIGINDIVDAAALAYLLKYDSVHGPCKSEVAVDGDSIVIAGRRAKVLTVADLSQLPWKALGVDFVIESTGKFTTFGQAHGHIKAGANRVIISAPPKSKEGEPPVKSFVLGVNEQTYDPKTDHVVSNASCTTNCIVPVAKVLHDGFHIQRGYMTTVHAYTNDQRILDQPHKDMRRARAAAVSMIPTSTGAAKLIAVIFPELKGR
ncbi:type I glyceraldehyde-3-phosphate dehydrogenase, partial [candidate division WOR-3 bacterium]|nr:type I glyceraldehyde-3-phosphate dehydrogenase [candidate division WOR-3 bacterium]